LECTISSLEGLAAELAEIDENIVRSGLSAIEYGEVLLRRLGVVPRTVELQIQTAKNLTPEAKEIMKGTDAKITRETARKLSRLEPGQQKEAASKLAAGEIRSVEEYTAGMAESPADTGSDAVPPQAEVQNAGAETDVPKQTPDDAAGKKYGAGRRCRSGKKKLAAPVAVCQGLFHHFSSNFPILP